MTDLTLQQYEQWRNTRLCQVCNRHRAVKVIEFSGTGPRTGVYFDHETLSVCEGCYLNNCDGKPSGPDEVIHSVVDLHS